MVKKTSGSLHYNEFSSRSNLLGKAMKSIVPLFILGLSFFGCSESGSTITYYTLTFNGNGAAGTPPPAVSALAFQYAPLPGKGGLSVTDKVFLNWNTAPDGSGIPCNPGDKIQLVANTVLYARWQVKESGKEYKTFWARDTDDNWYTVEAIERADGNKCIIYVDILAADITDIASIDTTVTGIKNKYNPTTTGIHDKITGAFGETYNKGKVILLLLDIKDGYSFGSGGYVAGYFDPTHMLTHPNSNNAEMLFIDIYPGLYDWDNNGPNDELSQMYSTIAHELQHLINFSQTFMVGKSQKDLWIDEGLSTAAEYIYAGIDDTSDTSRIGYFNNSNTLKNGNYGTIPLGNNFFVWNGFWEQEHGDVLADYATAYLFFRWLGIHGSEGIYKEIIKNDNGNYLSVTTAAKSKIPSLFTGLSPDTNEKRWETLLGTWMLANYYNSPDGPNKLYGYKGEIKTTVLVFDDTNHTGWPFSPGEGIFSKQTGSFSTGPNTGYNIRYRGLTKTPLTPPVESAPYKGTTLLTFNTNTNTNGGDETGYLAGMAGTGTGPALSASPAGLSVRAAGSVSAGGTAYPVGFGDKAAGLDRPGKAASR